MEETNSEVNTPNDEEVVVDPYQPKEYGLPPDVDDTPEETENVDALRQKNQELYEQLKKAKGFVRNKEGKWVKKEQLDPEPRINVQEGDITKIDLYALVKANVPEEDTKEVILYAKGHGIDVTSALKTPEVKALLKVREEYRKTAEATNTTSSRYGASKVSQETLLVNASKGILPTDEEGLNQLAKARIEAKRRK